MEAAFRDDMSRAQEIHLDAWKQRPFGDKIKELFSKAWSYWL